MPDAIGPPLFLERGSLAYKAYVSKFHTKPPVVRSLFFFLLCLAGRAGLHTLMSHVRRRHFPRRS